MSVTLARRADVARTSAVRIGARNHAGYLTCVWGPDGTPTYGAQCGAGRNRADGATTRPGNSDAIDCGNCVRRHAAAVAVIHAAQDAAAGVAPMVDADQAANGPAVHAPRVGLLIRTRTPRDMWAAIVARANANGTDQAARRRAAWIVEAFRHVYGLSMSAMHADIMAAHDQDTRDDDTRAGEYLAAYAGQIDDRAESIDQRAVAYRTYDAEQRIAGARPHSGTWVFVAGHAGRWLVIDRSPVEERRFPFAVRVQQEGHTFNGSVPLSAVTPVMADAAVIAQSEGWIPVATTDARECDQDSDAGAAGEREEWLSDVVTGHAAVLTNRDRDGNVWAARGLGDLTSATAPTRGAALAALRVLDTMTAGQLASRPGVVGAVGAIGWRLILPDGTPATVSRVSVHTGADRAAYGPDRATPGGYGYTPGTFIDGPSVRVAVILDERADRLPMRSPSVARFATPGAADFAVLVLPLHGRVALAPPCAECVTDPGAPCRPWCSTVSTL